MDLELKQHARSDRPASAGPGCRAKRSTPGGAACNDAAAACGYHATARSPTRSVRGQGPAQQTRGSVRRALRGGLLLDGVLPDPGRRRPRGGGGTCRARGSASPLRCRRGRTGRPAGPGEGPFGPRHTHEESTTLGFLGLNLECIERDSNPYQAVLEAAALPLSYRCRTSGL